MKSKKIFFENQNGQKLAARLDFPPEGNPVAFALFAHCFTCNKNFKAIRNINTSLTEAGFAVLRFDFTGLGESEGDFADTNFSSNVEDLIAASNFLAKEYQAPKLLVGHSLGGAAILLASSKLTSAKAIATIGAPSEPLHVKKHFKGHLEKIRELGEIEVQLGGRPFTVKKQLLDDLETVKIVSQLRSTRKALLVMHSPQDNVVGIDNASGIFKAAMHPKSFISLDGADHMLSDKEDSRYAGRMIAAWAARYTTD